MERESLSAPRHFSFAVSAAVVMCLGVAPVLVGDTIGYVQTNLVSNGAAPAKATDPNLVNPWGLTSLPASPFWVSDQGTGESTLYDGNGNVIPLVVTIPAGAGAAEGPTGIVANTSAGFAIAGTPARFIFSTLQGTIAGWNGGTTAVTEATVVGAMFTGLAIGTIGSANFLYAADFAGGKIDAFNTNFSPVTLAGFTDPNLPAGYSPYNIQNVGGKLYVEYAPVGAKGLPAIGPGNGIVDVFDTTGLFLNRLVSNGELNVPWGITMAPASFGLFGNDLLIGNFGNGEIDAFNPVNGSFLGTVDNAQGQPLVNDFLWGLEFGNGSAKGGNPNTLYFTAGIDNQLGGLFGSIQATPEPSPIVLCAVALLGLMAFRKKQELDPQE
jgi:uncharacterized protein (TIGR03118 family)